MRSLLKPSPALALGIGSLLLAGCGSPRDAADRVNVLLVTLDTTRADRLACFGNAPIKTPHLDRIARMGSLFENAFTPVPSTLPSHCSIMTGMHPARHQVHDNGIYVVPDGMSTLAERFHEEGYATGAFVSAFVLERQFGLDQGFDRYDDELEQPLLARDPREIARLPNVPDDRRRWLIQQASPFQRRADAVTDSAAEWLKQLEGQSFFLWVHYFDPHQPYQPPAPWDRVYESDYEGEQDGDRHTFARVAAANGWQYLKDIPDVEMSRMAALYDAEISFADEQMGRLFRVLEGLGRWDETLVVIVGDHGEAFGEHGQIWEHNAEIFDEVTRVPMLIRCPDGHGAGTRVRPLVRTMDLAPTILDYTGLSELGETDGATLLPLMSPSLTEDPRECLLEASRPPQIVPNPYSYLGLRTEKLKVVLKYGQDDVLAGQELYDLEQDAAERQPRSEMGSEGVEQWARKVAQDYQAMSAPGDPLPRRSLDDATTNALRSLGYVD